MGRDNFAVEILKLLIMFQSTRPRGARLVLVVVPLQHQRFQSTRPRGARRAKIRQIALTSCFNPRAHVGRDSGRGCARGLHGMFQSTRPRGARLVLRFSVRKGPRVSIHAPTWGATTNPDIIWGKFKVSIHAPTWGATVVM